MKQHEHLRWDVSPAALEVIADALEGSPDSECGCAARSLDVEVMTEIVNFINECRARVQHAAAGEPDISQDFSPLTGEALPGRSDSEDWI